MTGRRTAMTGLRTGARIGEAETIPEVMHRGARQFANVEALVEGERRLTFAALEQSVDTVARALVASGIGAGDRVAIWAPNSLAWIVASLGIYSAGAVMVPINTRFKGEEAGHVLRTSGARLLFTVTDFLGTDFPALLEGVENLDGLQDTVVIDGPIRRDQVAWESFLGRAPAVPAAEVRAREAALTTDSTSDIIFTSGTTGAPKGAMLTHGASVRTYRAWAERVGLLENDRYLVVYPLFHTAGLKSGALACLLMGATVVPHAVFDVPSVIRRVVEERITVLPGPPTVFLSIMNDPDLPGFDLSTLRLSVTGAATTPPEVIRRMRDDLHIGSIVCGYGLTETHGTVSMCHHTDSLETVATTVGYPLDGVDVRILGADDSDMPSGQPGEIVVRGFNVMKGYFHDPEATKAAFLDDGWFRTGDIGVIDDHGYIRITDRKKDMFIVGGFNAYPAEIEAIILEHPTVAQVAVIGVPDERLGEVGMAFVIPRPSQTVEEQALIGWCRERMANYKVPRRIKAVSELPLNPSGKVMKFRLREQIDQT
jgi:acyl-CoA synthetase (AMP-forming)/AMP-acid ligase II